ncbi:hypothetical protein D3C79_652390 [compost metagenome]
MQQLPANLLLEPTDLVTDRGLGQIQLLRRARKAAGFGNRNEGAQQCRVNVHRAIT